MDAEKEDAIIGAAAGALLASLAFAVITAVVTLSVSGMPVIVPDVDQAALTPAPAERP